MKLKFLLLLLFLTGITNAQVVPITDANFLDKLIYQGIDTNGDGLIQVSEAEAATELYLSSANISNLDGIGFFTNITSLECNYNIQLTTLDLSNNTNLTTIQCWNNNLTTLDISMLSNLVGINAQDNNLTTIYLSNNNNLETIRLSTNNFTSLDFSSCPSLKYLYCGSNNNLANINVTSNPLLKDFHCTGAQFSSIDLSNNTNLRQLSVGDNYSLNNLDISFCTQLEYLYCARTSLSHLDLTFNSNISSYLNFEENPNLETVFLKNGIDESIEMDAWDWSANWDIDNNPSLIYVCADEFQIAEIQQWLDPSVNLNTYCSFNPGGDYNTITGVVQYDENNDGCDNLDLPIPFMSIDLNLNGTSTNSTVYGNDNGVYSFNTSLLGTYTLIPNLENPNYFTVSPAPADVVISVIDNSTSIQDFCIAANGVHQDLEVVLTPLTPARPGFEATYQLLYKNNGNQTLSGEVLFAYEDAVLDFVSSSINPDTQTTGLLSFNFSNLLPLQYESVVIILDVNSPSDTPPINIDDVLSFVGTVNPIDGDENPDDNIFEYDQIVVGSYDPNDITCIQGDLVPVEMIGEYLHYVINFENTGNFPAENVVVVKDINPEDFDINTLQVLNTSHPVDIRIVNTKIEFIFSMINLAEGAQGNILLKIETLEDLDVTDVVNASAEIYFDYNFPIETNEAITAFQTLGFNTNEIGPAISIFPNPAKDILTIQAETNIKAVIIYDIQGRIVYSEKLNNMKVSTNVSGLKSGVYFLKISTERGEKVKKIIKI